MAEPINDFEKDEERPIFTSRRRRGRSFDSSFWAIGAVLALLVALIAAVALGWFRRGDADSTVQPSRSAAGADAATPDASAAEGLPEPLAMDLPELDASDALVRRLAQTLSSNPALAEWLASDEIVRLFVVAVTNLARGQSPAPQLDFMAPEEEFSVRDAGDVMRIDPAGYRRYDGLVGAFVSLDDEGVADLYRRLLPLCEEAYRELGLPGGSFSPVLARAMDNLVSFRVPREAPTVVEDGAVYAFADTTLEELSPAEKHLLRMGPENADRVQAKIRALAAAMGITLEH